MFYGQAGMMQPPTPQQLAAGLQRQQMMRQMPATPMPAAQVAQAPQGQMPMSMQRQPQGGMAGRTVPKMPVQPMSRF